MSRIIPIVVLLAICIAPPAQAQVTVLLPPDQLGKSTFDIPPDMIIRESVFNSVPNYEPIYVFTEVNRYRKLGRSVGRLDILLVEESTGNAGVTNCTASIISGQYILTNYHCVPGMEPGLSVSRAILRMGFLDEHNAAGEVFEVDIRPVEANREMDYAVLRVNGNPSAKYGAIPLRVRDPDPGEELFIIHHPKGMTQRLTRRNCRMISSATAITRTEVRHRCDTFGGSSGSLIFSDNNIGDEFVVVGIHFAGFKEGAVDAYNTAKRMTTVLTQSPVLREVASGSSPAPRPVAVNPSTSTDNKIVLTPPSVLFAGQDIPDDKAPVFTTLSRQVTFEWGLKQIYSYSSEGFESLKEFGQQSDLGDYSSKINLTQYASSPEDNCAVNDRSTLQGANVWVYCNLGRVSSYDTVLQFVKNTMPIIRQTIADDERGFAVRFTNGTALCLDKHMGSLAQLTGADQLLSLTIWSSATADAECFRAPPIKLK